LWEKGRLLAKEGQWSLAAKAFECAVELDPKDEVYLLNAAQACFNAGQLEASVQHAKRVIEIDNASELAYQMLTRALTRMHRHAEVLAFMGSMPGELRHTVEYWVGLGLANQASGRPNEAIKAYMSALEIKLDDATVHYRMGLSFYDLKLKEEAAECFRTALALGLGPYTLHALGLLVYAERESCRWAVAADDWGQIEQVLSSVADDAAAPAAVFAHAVLTDDPAHLLKVAGLMANMWREVPAVAREAQVSSASRERRVKVGYVSSDFHDHATCVLMAEMLEHHDRSLFEVYLYSHGEDDHSSMRRRIEVAGEHFVDLIGLDDQQIAERIAQDGVDILIDLKGYTANNKFGVFARRPAPLQVSFLGFPGTTGASFIDYIVGDPVVTPLNHSCYYKEKIVQMPVCYQPNDRQRPLPQAMSRSQVGLPDDALVLCGFNQAYKVSPDVLSVWCSLLTKLPGSVLWLLDWHGQAKPNLEKELVDRGVDLSRVFWAPRVALAEHISRVALADIFIDTWPCNAHTTASDALWAGVPLVTLIGDTFASRVAASLLNAVGASELIAQDEHDYVAKVLRLATDLTLRNEVRQKLVTAREQAPLFDSKRFAKDFEGLLLRMLDKHANGLMPDHLSALL
jgi:predicted O-linked N-acetylglucosamine transferase (SPINDLY family)